jgi:hypothetical protein
MLPDHCGIDLVQHRPAVEQRPHLTDRLVTDSREHAAELVEDGVDHALLGAPVLARARELRCDRAALAVVARVRHELACAALVRHVVDARTRVDHRPELGMRRHVPDALAAHPDLAAVAQGRAVLIARADHRLCLLTGALLGDERGVVRELGTIASWQPDGWWRTVARACPSRTTAAGRRQRSENIICSIFCGALPVCVAQ